VILNPGASDVSTPLTHQPHVYLSPSLPSESSQTSIQADQKKKKWKEKKKKNQKETKPPTISDVGSKQPTTINSTRSVDEVKKIKMKNLKPKFPCSICKGDHFLRDFPGLPKVLKMWSSTSSTPFRHAGDSSSTSDIKVGKKKTTVKFPCMLCEGDQYSHLCPCMDEASSLLKNLQLPTSYRKISPNPSLVDGMINPVPSLVNLVDQVVNLVSSSIEPLTQVVDPVPSSISPTFHLKSETQVPDLVPSFVNPTPPLKSAKVVDMVPPSVDPTPPLTSAKVVAPVRSSVNPTPPLKSAKVVDLVPPSVNPTLPLESKPDTTHIFLIDTRSTVLGGIPPSSAKTPPSNDAILFDWGVLTGPRLPSHIPFKITVQVCGWDVPHALID
jgi:hypothetical protein